MARYYQPVNLTNAFLFEMRSSVHYSLLFSERAVKWIIEKSSIKES